MSYHADTPTSKIVNTDFTQIKDWPEILNYEDPIILLDIAGTVNGASVEYHYSTDDYVTTSGIAYKAAILNDIALKDSLADIVYGIQQTDAIEIELTNVDDGINDTWDTIIANMTGTEDIRGWTAILWIKTTTDGIRFAARATVTNYTLSSSLKIQIDPREDGTFDTILPLKTITVDDWTETAIDAGSPINICFGYCRNVPCFNVQNNKTDDYYDYLIGHGPIQGLWTDTGLGVKRDGVLVDTSEYTFYDGSQVSPYPGYAFIRFTREQLNFSGGYHSVTADVIGLLMGAATAQRNGAEVLRQLLSNTTWGLSDNVNTASFDAAATVLDPTTGSLPNLYIDGAITEQTQARDYINELLDICRASLNRNRSGEWEIMIDHAGRASVLNLNEQNFQIEDISTTDLSECLKTGEVRYCNREPGNPALKIILDVHGFGKAGVFEYRFVHEDNTAKKILSYKYGREMYSEGSRNGIVSGFAGIEARRVKVGDIVTLTDSARGFSEQDFVVMSTDYSPGAKPYHIILRKYSSDIYADQTISSPTSITEPGLGTRKIGTGTFYILYDDDGKYSEFSGYVYLRYKVPSGIIIPFNATSIPPGWERFTQMDGKHVIGAGNSYSVADTGGVSPLAISLWTSYNGSHTGYSLAMQKKVTYMSVRYSSDAEAGGASGSHSHHVTADYEAAWQQLILIRATTGKQSFPANSIVLSDESSVEGLSICYNANKMLRSGAAISNGGGLSNKAFSSSGIHIHQLGSDMDDLPPTSGAKNTYNGTHSHSYTFTVTAEEIKRAYLTAWTKTSAFEGATGMIAMWEGTEAPDGWKLCDGTNGTLDLRDYFIILSDTTNVGNRYDAANRIYVEGTVASNSFTHGHDSSIIRGYIISAYHSSASFAHNHTISSAWINYTPAYYALTFIQKL
jgi:hypothetical protein